MRVQNWSWAESQFMLPLLFLMLLKQKYPFFSFYPEWTGEQGKKKKKT